MHVSIAVSDMYHRRAQHNTGRIEPHHRVCRCGGSLSKRGDMQHAIVRLVAEAAAPVAFAVRRQMCRTKTDEAQAFVTHQFATISDIQLAKSVTHVDRVIVSALWAHMLLVCGDCMRANLLLLGRWR